MTETSPTCLVARTPEDLLAMVPIVIGFAPDDSVVMLTFGAEHTFHARIDLPHRADDVHEMVQALLDPAARNGVHRVVVVLYTAHPGPARRAWQALRRGFRDADIAVLEAVRAHGGRWYPLLAGDRMLRENGVPYDISGHRFAVQAVVDGRVTHRSRAELAALLDRDDARAAVVAELAAGQSPPPPDPETEARWVEALVRRHVADGTSPTDAEVARLVCALRVDGLRDAAWSSLVRSAAQRHVDLWVDVLRRTPAAYTPPVATLLGMAAWQSGHGALAWCAVDRCAEVDPDYAPMSYLASALTHALPPSAWEAGTGMSA